MFEKLKNHKTSLIGIDECSKFAVCIVLLETPRGYEVLFEVRSAKINRQPGDVCFPGGMVENGELPKDGALRECMEELLIDRSQLEIIGLMDVLYLGNIIVYPFAAILRDYKGTFSTDEVGDIFTVPLEFFFNTQPEVYYTNTQIVPEDNFPFELIHNGKNYKWRTRRESIYFYKYDGHVIWGMTAKMIRSFVTIYLQDD